jgi:hypothetical protein
MAEAQRARRVKVGHVVNEKLMRRSSSEVAVTSAVTAADEIRQHRFVFVGGLHRTGTTLMRSLIGAHPDVSSFSATGVPEDEGQHLQDVYPTARHYGGPGRFAFAPEAHLTESSPLATPESANRLWQAWSSHWDVAKPVLVEKSPPNLIMSRFLNAMFRDSHFVMMIRHPVAVADATQAEFGTSPHALIKHWLRAYELMLDDATHVPRMKIVRYEDLVANPDGVVSDVYQFLGLVDVPVTEVVRGGSNAAHFQRWMRRSARAYLSRIESVALAKRVAAFGYSMREPHEAHRSEPHIEDPVRRLPRPHRHDQ